MVSTSMRSWWKCPAGARNSFRISRGTKEKTCRATWWGTWPWWSGWKRSRLRSLSCWQAGTCSHGLVCQSGLMCKSRACAGENLTMTKLVWLSWECLEEITDQTRKDLNRQGRDEAFYEEDQVEDDCLYEEEGYEDWFGDGEEYGYGHDEECYYEDAEEPLPSDVESAVDQTEEAYVNYLESRRRMRDLALSRGFYPIVALGPEVGQQAYGRKGDGKGKGKGKSKGGKSKGKGKSKSFTRTFQNRRPMSGLRRSNGTTSTSASSTTSTSSGSELRSTLSGSTAQHGPRFKAIQNAEQWC